MLRLGRAVLVLIGLMLAAAPAYAGDRFALVIANQAYNEKVGPLRNPHNDIALVGSALTEVGFNLLPPRKDVTRDGMLFGVHDLASKLRKAGRGAVGFLYYAGHGVAVGDENVLIPVNAEDTTDAMLNVRGVRLGEILDILKREAPDAVHFVVLDACRNIRGQRGERGFAPVNDQRTGVVIAFATAAGRTATDEGAASAPYAAALAEEIVKPARNDQAVFNAVRARVVSGTRHRTPPQTPWTHDGLVGERVVFKTDLLVAPAPVAVAQPQASDASERAWNLVKDMADLRTLEAFRRQYGAANAFFDRLAEARIEYLKQAEAKAVEAAAKQAALAAKHVADEDIRIKAEAERQRLAMQQQQLRQEERKREDERRRADAQRADAEAARKEAGPANATKTGRVFRDCADCPEMVVVPAGSFIMGSPASEEGRSSDEGPQRQVTIAQPFAAGKYEVTFAEWDACVAAGGCKHGPGEKGWGRGKRPVISVSWKDITQEYLPWLSRTTGKAYRLLTEAEWEYAARAGTTTPFSIGRTITPAQANFDGNQTYGGSAKGAYRQKTVEVGSFQPNAFGLHDMHGNVWEWVQDCYKDTHAGAPSDGSAAPDTAGCSRVLRGGSWGTYPRLLRSAHRNKDLPTYRINYSGFRVGRTLIP